MDDLTRKARDRQSQKQSARLDKVGNSPPPPAIVAGYDVNTGRYTVQQGRDIIPGCKAITNGTLATGQPVAIKGRLIDAMRRPRVVEEEPVISAKFASAMYVYTTGGSAPNRTALCVAGAKQGWTVQIDEWANSEFSLRSATIDNLGGTDFIVSYVLRKAANVVLPTTVIPSFENTFKVSRNGSNIFSYTLDPKYVDETFWFGSRLSLGLRFTSVGCGNWIGNAFTDVSTQNLTGSQVLGDIVFRLSDPTLNPQSQTQIDILPYVRNLAGTPPSSFSITPSYGYLNPRLQVSTYFNGQTNFHPGPLVSFTYISQLSIFDCVCMRVSRNGKSLSYYRRTEASYDPAPELFSFISNQSPNKYASGSDHFGYSIVASNSSQPVEIPFRTLTSQSQSASVVTDYSCAVNITQGSDIATVTSGNIPPVGAVLTTGAVRYGVTILESNGSTLKLSEPAQDTTELPDNPTSIGWGFPFFHEGILAPIDLLLSGVSYFSIQPLTLRKAGSPISTPQILSEPIDLPIALFGYDLRPTAYKTMKVYSPTIINQGTNISNNFRVHHASYSDGNRA